MVATHPAPPSDHVWLYELVPSTALPTVDLSQSLKSRYLPPSALRAIDAFLLRWKYTLAIAYAASLLLTSTMLYIEAPAGRIAAVLTLVLGLPLGLGSLGALRFEMVRLLIREGSVLFFVLLNIVTQATTVILLGDLRGLYLVSTVIGFTNSVLIDARLRAVRTFMHLCMVSVFVVSACLVALMLEHVDNLNDLQLWQYQEGLTLYNVCLSEYVTTGLFTLLILLTKILYRKHRTMHDSSVITCTMLRCRVKLVACSPQTAPSDLVGPCLSSLGSSNPVQQLKLVHSERVYDARKILFPMVLMSCTKPFPWFFLALMYSLGAVGAIILFTTPYYGNAPSDGSTYATAMMVTLFTTSLAFWMAFAACYQRELLRSLVFSFDFIFYSFQITTVLFAGACLGHWERNQCLWLMSNWIWAHWVFCLDALTPLMRTRLRFHVKLAVPMVFMQLLGGIKLLCDVTTHTLYVPEDSVLWSGQVLGHQVKLHVLPFLVNRMILATTWTIRMLLRLCRASNSDAIIMKGTVSYVNYLSRATSTSSTRLRITSRVSPTISKLRLGAHPKSKLVL